MSRNYAAKKMTTPTFVYVGPLCISDAFFEEVSVPPMIHKTRPSTIGICANWMILERLEAAVARFEMILPISPPFPATYGPCWGSEGSR
jgi:hypothetical protein